eukprot:COSAG02_NODE_11072_length_1800_cov_2.527337_2_plen_70_part_00
MATHAANELVRVHRHSRRADTATPAARARDDPDARRTHRYVRLRTGTQDRQLIRINARAVGNETRMHSI